jgi:hypothetical protein
MKFKTKRSKKMRNNILKQGRGNVVCVALVVAILAAAGSAHAVYIKDSKNAARHQRTSCQAQVLSDYWLAIANAGHLETKAEQNEAAGEAREEYYEARELCQDQYIARRELIDDLEEVKYNPDIDPADFDTPISNPYFPLTIGLVREYEGESEDGTETIVVTVTDETREILGVECIAVRDTVFLDGEEVEDTFDFYAIDNEGNVWYFGESTVEIEDGWIANTDGAWIAGEDDAKPGIIMPAVPTVGDIYRQEYLASEAEDAAEILSTTETVEIDFDTFEDCVQTADFTPIEPDTLEHKFHAPGVGTIVEVDVESGDSVELTDIYFLP